MNSKNKFEYLHFYAYGDGSSSFTAENFKNSLIKSFKLNTTYSILIKIAYEENKNFKMVGTQIGVKVSDKHNLKEYDELFLDISERINATLDLYDESLDISLIQIMYRTYIPQPELKLKNIKNIELPKIGSRVSKTRDQFDSRFLPFTPDTSFYGNVLCGSDCLHYIELINNKNSIIKKENNKANSFSKILEKDEMFLYNAASRGSKVIIVSQKIVTKTETDTFNYLRHVFSEKSGLLLFTAKDTLFTTIDKFKKDKNNLFIRTQGAVSLTIKNQKVIKYTLEECLPSIKPNNMIPLKGKNFNFGTFDLETFIDSDGISKVYALGFLSNLDQKPSLFYLTDFPKKKFNTKIKINDYDFESLILKCINSMLINKYNNFIFYCHNFGGYDVYFIYKTLLNFNEKSGFNYYKLNTFIREDTIFKLTITVYVNSELNENKDNKKKKSIKITFVDSLNLLNNSLANLSKDFKVKTKKGIFPYSFVKKESLNYIGALPDKSHFNIDLLEYNNLLKQKPIWNLREETLYYLENDLKALLEVLIIFSNTLYVDYNCQMTDGLTITRLALNIFLNNYYDFNFKPLPLINKSNYFNFIKEGYYGGITEVYKPYGKNLIYLDVNSLYPYAALNPMAGTNCTYLHNLGEGGLDLDNLFGFFYAKVKTTNDYLGLLPLHTDKNSLIHPNGEFYGIWFSEELKFAKQNGYDITVIKGYNFNKVYNSFNTYIQNLYKTKAQSKDSERTIAKSLLNNLLGRFGLNMIKPIKQIVDLKKRDLIAATRSIYSQKLISDNSYLISYNPVISKTICEEHGLDYIKVLNSESKTKIESYLDLFKDVSITTSAMTTAYARIQMNKFKLEILKNGGIIYYSDTDSLVIDTIYLNPEWIGTNLGQFKLVYEIKEAYFLSNKTYCLVLRDGSTIVVAKGVIKNSLTLEDFKAMYWNKQNVTVKKTNTLYSYENAYATIEEKNITLNHDSYTKRTKIYNNDGIWIDTKPLIIKE